MNTHALPRPNFAHLADVHPRPRLLQGWERVRHRQAHWFVECAAEFMGVFLYVFAGVGSTAPYVLGNLLGTPLGSLLQIGFAYALGIVFALVVCGPTSGGHFNPAVTLANVLLKGMPVKKALRYIVAQILGSYVACLLIYVQYHQMISEAEALLVSKGTFDSVNFTAQGPAGIFALYVLPTAKLGQVFLNEFVCDFVIGLVIWTSLDPTNFLVSPTTAPWLVALAYSMAVWGFAPVGLATNTARDLGARLMTLTIWGMKAGGGAYAAIAALTNIVATLTAITFYEFILTDSARVIAPSHADFLAGHLAHQEHAQQMHTPTMHPDSPSTFHSTEKAEIERVERVDVEP